MSFTVLFSPEAEAQLLDLSCYVVQTVSPVTAAVFTEAIVSFCEELKEFPHCGTMRDDIRPGLRITHYKTRTIIAFAVLEDIVAILVIYYGGQNYEAKLKGALSGDE